MWGNATATKSKPKQPVSKTKAKPKQNQYVSNPIISNPIISNPVSEDEGSGEKDAEDGLSFGEMFDGFASQLATINPRWKPHPSGTRSRTAYATNRSPPPISLSLSNFTEQSTRMERNYASLSAPSFQSFPINAIGLMLGNRQRGSPLTIQFRARRTSANSPRSKQCLRTNIVRRRKSSVGSKQGPLRSKNYEKEIG